MTNLSVGKLPRPAPGEFRFVTKALGIDPAGDDGKRRFRMVASSTVVDEGKDEIKPSALEDLRASFSRGLNIFTDHEHKVDNVFGRSDTAEIKNSGENDPKTGAPIYDLHIAGVVNEPNPRMAQLADSIDGGYVTFGASIGARVTEHKRNKAGGMDIYRIDGKEASLVGIPMNQRSWTYKAAKAAAALDSAAPDEDEDEEEASADALAVTSIDTSTANGTSNTITVTNSKALDTTEGDTQKSLDSLGIEIVTGDPTKTAEPDGQESAASEDEEETPETASESEGTETDPADEQKALVFEEADVVTLAMKARVLAEAVVIRDEEIETLKAENNRLAAENEAAQQVIEKMLAQPLRRKAIEPAITLSKRLPDFLAPEVKNFLTKTAGDNT